MIWQLCFYFIWFITLWYLKLRFVSNTFWSKIPKSRHCDMYYTYLITYLQTSGFFQTKCWQWGSSFCLIFKLFITCQPKKCVTELKVIWNEVMYKNSDSTATLLTNDSLIEGCLWVSSDKQGHRLIAFRIKQQWCRFERFVQKIVYVGWNMPCLICTKIMDHPNKKRMQTLRQNLNVGYFASNICS